jgi:CTD small phosphatase-like protein 2
MKPRPHLHSFLLEMYKYYELIVFTAGTQEYADPILNIIDKKNNIFDKRLYRQHAIIVDESFVKDLSLLGRDLKKVIIVDNNPHNYDLQKENGIFIKSFYGEKDDNVLVELIPILQKIASNKDNDVRVELLKLKDEIFTKITTNLKE